MYNLFQARNAVKLLRLENWQAVLKNFNLKKPALDNATRWNSVYNMLMSFIATKPLCESFSITENAFKLSENEWQSLNSMLQGLKPLRDITIKLQSEQLVPGDLLKSWMYCQLQLENQDTNFSRELLNAMERRQGNLFENDGFLASIYLDPRLWRIFTNKFPGYEQRALDFLRKVDGLVTKEKEQEERLNVEGNPEVIVMNSFTEIKYHLKAK